MKIVKSKWVFAAVIACTAGFTGCSDWTEVEAEQILDYTNVEPSRPETYYESLRAYKESDHAVAFGWFSDWVEPSGAMTNSLAAVPDSMDIVSLWGGWGGLTEERLADVRYVQEKKGMKVIPCTFTSFCGQNFTPEEYGGNSYTEEDKKLRDDFWGWVDGDEAAMESAIRKYAHAMIDTVAKYNYDGIDLDYEPNFGYEGPLASFPDRMHILLEELSTYMGPKSPNPDKLLIVDGEPYTLNAESGPYLSYFVIQAYSGTQGSTMYWSQNFTNLDIRLDKLIRKFGETVGEEQVTRHTIMTENLEPALESLEGGYPFYDREGLRIQGVPSLVGMAMWEPVNGFRKGGFGAYRFSNEAVNKPAYKWMRKAIQVQNPAIK